MKNKRPYLIAWGDQIESLESAANRLIADGYIPIGGVSYRQTGSAGYTQAMILKDHTNERD